jgi:hypothetical protein
MDGGFGAIIALIIVAVIACAIALLVVVVFGIFVWVVALAVRDLSGRPKEDEL